MNNPPQNVGGPIEDEANSIAGVLIKDFTHNQGFDRIYDMCEAYRVKLGKTLLS